jgi:hypothetical protein
LYRVVGDEDREEEDDGLEGVEEEREGLVENPAECDHEGDLRVGEAISVASCPRSTTSETHDKESDLDGRADGDSHGQVELVMNRDRDGGNVLWRKERASVLATRLALGVRAPDSRRREEGKSLISPRQRFRQWEVE